MCRSPTVDVVTPSRQSSECTDAQWDNALKHDLVNMVALDSERKGSPMGGTTSGLCAKQY